MRIVLDANVYLSFILTRGETVASIFSAWEEELFSVFASPRIVEEIKSALGYPKIKKIVSKDDQAYLALLLERLQLVDPQEAVKILPDSKDNMYLECATECKADYLVTGDKKHLLPLRVFGRTKVVSPSKFAKILSTQKPCGRGKLR